VPGCSCSLRWSLWRRIVFHYAVHRLQILYIHSAITLYDTRDFRDYGYSGALRIICFILYTDHRTKTICAKAGIVGSMFLSPVISLLEQHDIRRLLTGQHAT
jgi:hypothetical protein